MDETSSLGVPKMIDDMVFVGIWVGTVAGILTPIASLLGIVYMIIRIWESETVRRWMGRS